jgi:hypothetical protein
LQKNVQPNIFLYFPTETGKTATHWINILLDFPTKEGKIATRWIDILLDFPTEKGKMAIRWMTIAFESVLIIWQSLLYPNSQF